MALLEISLSAVLLIVIVMIIRCLVIYRISKKVFVFLWSLILLRLILPFTVTSEWYLFQQTSKTIGERSIPNVITVIRNNEQLIASKSSVSTNVLIIIYTTGIILMGLYFLMIYYRSYKMFSKSQLIENAYVLEWKDLHRLKRKIEVKEVKGITSPLTYGIVKPVILLPQGFDWDNIHQVDYVFEHEYIHIKNFDVLKKTISLIVLIIHWFNPFVWILYILLNRDIELACDEEVIYTFGKSKKSEYATTLLNIEERRSLKGVFSPSFSSGSIEERIRLIMKAKKNSIIIAVFSTVLLIGAFIYVSSPAAAKTSKMIIDEVEEVETANENSGYKTTEMSWEEFMAYLETRSYENPEWKEQEIEGFLRFRDEGFFGDGNVLVTEGLQGIDGWFSVGGMDSGCAIIETKDGACDLIYASDKELGEQEVEKCKMEVASGMWD